MSRGPRVTQEAYVKKLYPATILRWKPLARNPNVRDLAAEIQKRSAKPMALAVLAPRVAKARGKKPGKAFAMNLGAALRKDRRFRRAGRGVYTPVGRG